MGRRSYFLRWAIVIANLIIVVGCRDPGSLELVWSVRQGLIGQWGIQGEEVFTVGRYLTVYDLSTGRELRRGRLPHDFADTTLGQIGPEIAITDSDLLFGWYDFGHMARKQGNLFCYDPKTLTLRWERTFAWSWEVRTTRPTFSVLVNGNYAYALAIAKEGENLFKARLSDGNPVWATRVEKYAQGAPLILYKRKLLVRSIVSPWSQDAYGNLQGIDSETGRSLWRVRIEGRARTVDDPTLISGDRAYFTTEASSPVSPDTSNFYIVDLMRGTVLSHLLLRSLRAPFAEHQGILFFGGNVPATFDVSRGQIVWETHLEGPQGLPPSVAARGLLDLDRKEIYLGDSERDLFILSSTTGEVKDKLYIRGYWRGELLSPLKAFFGSYGVKRLELVRGLLFVGTVDGSLFVFRRR